MKSTDLRQLIRESIQEYIRNIDEAGTRAAHEAKIRACEEAIALREKRVNLEGLEEEMQEMIDKSKIADIKKEIKVLGKTLEKYKKQLAKMDGKSEPKKEKEMVDESPEVTAEINMEGDPNKNPPSGPGLEEGKMSKKEKAKKEDIVKAMKKSKSFGKSKEEKAKIYATATKLATKESVNESFLHMQKLAGLITETEYKQKLNENMKLFDLKDKNNKPTELFRIENFTSVEEVINKLNQYLGIEDGDTLYTDDSGTGYNYAYVASDGDVKFVKSLDEFDDGYKTEEEWGVSTEKEI